MKEGTGNTTHTPGPWHWVGNELCNADRQTVLEVQDTPEHAYPELQSGELVMPNEIHDRPLIAAAPDLLAACEMALRYIGTDPCECVTEFSTDRCSRCCAMEHLQEVISKAKAVAGMTEPEDILMERLKATRTMPELDALRMDVVNMIKSVGTQEAFDKLQQAFIQAKNRLQRIPLRDRQW